MKASLHVYRLTVYAKGQAYHYSFRTLHEREEAYARNSADGFLCICNDD